MEKCRYSAFVICKKHLPEVFEVVGSGSDDASVASDVSGSEDSSSVFLGPSAVTVVESLEDALESEIKFIM